MSEPEEEAAKTSVVSTSDEMPPPPEGGCDDILTKPAAVAAEEEEEATLTYRERAKANGIHYTVTDVPPLGLSMILGLQHYLTMLGATVLIPLLLCPAMGASGQQTADVISSIFFVSGINTLIQTSIGDRYVRNNKFVFL